MDYLVQGSQPWTCGLALVLSMPETGPHKQAKSHSQDAGNMWNMPLQAAEKISPWNQFLVPKRLGAIDLVH